MRCSTLAVAAAVAIGSSGGCGRTPPPPPVESAGPSAASAASRWVAARAARDLTLFEVPAVVRSASDASVVLAVPVRARVVRIAVRPGDMVSEGAVIAEVQLPELVQAAAAAQAAHDRLGAHKRWLGELRSLRGEGLVRAAEVFEAEAKVAELQAQIVESDAQLRAAGLTPTDGAALLRGATWPLRAPQGAVVRAVEADPGAVLDAGAVLVRLSALREARIEARLTRPLPRDAALQFVASSGEVIDLAGEATMTAIDPVDGAVMAWYRPLGAQLLAAGLRGRVRVAALQGSAVEVPARALIGRDGGAAVLLQGASGQAPQRQAVEVLAVSGPLALVRGIAAGTLIAAEADLAYAPEAGMPPAAAATPHEQP